MRRARSSMTTAPTGPNDQVQPPLLGGKDVLDPGPQRTVQGCTGSRSTRPAAGRPMVEDPTAASSSIHPHPPLQTGYSRCRLANVKAHGAELPKHIAWTPKYVVSLKGKTEFRGVD